MQIIGQNPLTILDCAHNEEGISSLVANLQQLFPNKSFRIVTAILRDKHIEPMISMLSSIASKLYISKNNSERAADIEGQIEVARKFATPFSREPDIVAALNHAQNEAEEGEIVIVTGSIYTVSEIISHLCKQKIAKQIS
jgi:dihydrofolate synthase/folylpolyglutamate synthase